MKSQVSRNVSLTVQLDAFVGQEVASGRFQNASEVVRAALRLMADHQVRLVPRVGNPSAKGKPDSARPAELRGTKITAA